MHPHADTPNNAIPAVKFSCILATLRMPWAKPLFVQHVLCIPQLFSGLPPAAEEVPQFQSPFDLSDEDIARFNHEVELGQRTCPPSESSSSSSTSSFGSSSIGGEKFNPDDRNDGNKPMFAAPGKPACVPLGCHDNEDGCVGAAEGPAADLGGGGPHFGGVDGNGSGGAASKETNGGGGRQGRPAAKVRYCEMSLDRARYSAGVHRLDGGEVVRIQCQHSFQNQVETRSWSPNVRPLSHRLLPTPFV